MPSPPTTNGQSPAPAPVARPRAPFTARDRSRWMLGLSIGVTLLLYWIPYGHLLIYPLLLLSTLAHEMGHGLTAELVGGDFDRFLMWSDGSGVASYHSSGSGLGQALIAAGGLLGPAVAAAILFALARSPRQARRVFVALALLLLLLLLLYVRNLFGFVFVGGLALLAALIARFAAEELAQLLLVFVAVQLSLAVFSRSDYLFTPVAETSAGVMPSDVAQMAGALLLPYWFWGAACGAVSLLVLWRGFRAFWR